MAKKDEQNNKHSKVKKSYINKMGTALRSHFVDAIKESLDDGIKNAEDLHGIKAKARKDIGGVMQDVIDANKKTAVNLRANAEEVGRVSKEAFRQALAVVLKEKSENDDEFDMSMDDYMDGIDIDFDDFDLDDDDDDDSGDDDFGNESAVTDDDFEVESVSKEALAGMCDAFILFVITLYREINHDADQFVDILQNRVGDGTIRRTILERKTFSPETHSDDNNDLKEYIDDALKNMEGMMKILNKFGLEDGYDVEADIDDVVDEAEDSIYDDPEYNKDDSELPDSDIMNGVEYIENIIHDLYSFINSDSECYSKITFIYEYISTADDIVKSYIGSETTQSILSMFENYINIKLDSDDTIHHEMMSLFIAVTFGLVPEDMLPIF